MNDIAVIIPVNNGSETLVSCIESVLLAGERISEIIIVDDGSTDDTEFVAKSLSSKDPRISIIHSENCGSYMARLRGVRAAKASYIAFLDVDDRFFVGALDILAKLLEDYDADIVMGRIDEIYTAGAEIISHVDSRNNPTEPRVLMPEQVWQRIMKWKTQEFLMYIWNKLYRRELFDQLPELDKICQGDDVILTCGAFLKAKRIVETSISVCLYYVNPASLTHRGFNMTDLDLIRVWDEVVKMVDKDTAADETKLLMTPSLLEMARYNRWRTDFTLICRLILMDDKATDRCYERELHIWREGLRDHWWDLVRYNAMPMNRELLVLALRFFFTPTKVLMRIGKRLTRIKTGMLLHSGDKL